ncbi:hypothetical protein MU582_05060 [Nocardioidaceae bacterium SCSIO 66511]|nr:hypothetical protein MU582_05060 [Nocardioidaceae bacterium SCSIO 66511]
MKRHPLDPLSLVLGIATLIGAALWLSWDQGNTDRNDILIAVPLILIIGGIAGIVLSAIASHRRKARNE